MLQSFLFPTELPRARSRRARRIARWFDLSWPRRATRVIEPDFSPLLPAAGQVLSITGASGSGKSALLRKLRSLVAAEDWLDLDSLPLPKRPLVDCFADKDLPATLSLLARVGLSEAWTFLRRPSELSEGQRWRLRLALGLDRAVDRPGTMLVCDEFAAVLDRVTAAVVARALRRSIVPPLRAIVATSHDDLARALAADRIVRCDFGKMTVEQKQERETRPHDSR